MADRPLGAAARLTEKVFGGSLVTKETNPATVAGVVNILPASPERVLMTLYNLGASEIYVGFSESVNTDKGFLLPPSGGFIAFNVTDDFEILTLPIYVFCVVANNQLYVVTQRRETAHAEVI